MSNEAITWAYSQKVTTGEKFVLVALADMADEAHSCYPGQAKLASMTGQGVRTVRRHLETLEAAGLISRQRRFNEDGHRTSDRYVLPVGQQIPTGQIDRRSKQPEVKTTGGQNGQRSSMQPYRPNSTVTTGQIGQVTQSINPKKNPQVEKRARATRLPEKWRPSDEDRAWTLERIDQQTAAAELDTFRDYWIGIGGAKGTKLDWNATWRNWVRKVQRDQRRPTGRASPRRGTTDERVSGFIELANDLRAAGK